MHVFMYVRVKVCTHTHIVHKCIYRLLLMSTLALVYMNMVAIVFVCVVE